MVWEECSEDEEAAPVQASAPSESAPVKKQFVNSAKPQAKKQNSTKEGPVAQKSMMSFFGKK